MTNLILAPAVQQVQEIVWVVAPEDNEAFATWVRCHDNWLDDLEARSHRQNTRRAYAADFVDFFAHWRLQRLMPWQVGRVHAQGWVQAMRERGLSDATINRKVAALSSFYRYAADEFEIKDNTGRSKSLWQHPNPFGSKKLRSKVKPYGRAKGRVPTTAQISLLFAQIDADTTQGLRDMALLLGMFATTRRVSEWSQLRWSDIRDGEGGKIFSYRYKGGEIKEQAMPADVWTIIDAYLTAAGRQPMQPDDPIFIAGSPVGSRFPTAKDGYDPAKQPISTRRVNALLRRYGAAAGLPEELLHAHALRHAGARARRKSGADIIDIKNILGHSSIAITQIYTDEILDEPEDPMAGLIVSQVMPKQLKLRFAK